MGVLFNPVQSATPLQLLERAARLARHERLADLAKPDTGIECISASQRAARFEPDAAVIVLRPKKIIPGLDVGYIPPPWIPPLRRDDGERSAGALEMRLIQNVCARFYGVTRADIISARRTANIVRPRQVAMFLIKTMTLKSLPQIGAAFGDRDHTTVLHAVRKIESLSHRDQEVAKELDTMRRQIEEA